MGRAQKESREVARRGRDEYVPVRGRCILLTADLPRSFPPRGASSQASTRAALVARLGGVRAVRPQPVREAWSKRPPPRDERRPCGTSARFGMIVILGMICPREGEVTLCRTHQCKRNFGGKARPRRGGGLERDTDVRFETVALDDVLAATAVVRSKASSSARADHLFITADPNHRGRRAVRPRQSKTLTRRVMLGHDLDGRRSPVERLRHTPEAGSVHQLRGARKHAAATPRSAQGSRGPGYAWRGFRTPRRITAIAHRPPFVHDSA